MPAPSHCAYGVRLPPGCSASTLTQPPVTSTAGSHSARGRRSPSASSASSQAVAPAKKTPCSVPENPRYHAMPGCSSARCSVTASAATASTSGWRQVRSSGANSRATTSHAARLISACTQLTCTRCAVSARHGWLATRAWRYSSAPCSGTMACTSSTSAAPPRACRSAAESCIAARSRVCRSSLPIESGPAQGACAARAARS